MDKDTNEFVGLSDLFNKKNIFLNLNSSNKWQLLDDICQKIKKVFPQIDENLLLKDLKKREEELSTGIGKGIAIPHTKTKAINKIIVVFARHNGIDFDSLDGKPTKLFFVVVVPTDCKEDYMNILQFLTIKLRNSNFRENLISARTVDEVLKILKENLYPY